MTDPGTKPTLPDPCSVALLFGKGRVKEDPVRDVPSRSREQNEHDPEKGESGGTPGTRSDRAECGKL